MCANVEGDETGCYVSGTVAVAASSGVELARVHLACGRIVGGARAIADAHRFGVREGPHYRLWEAEYHAEAVRVYGESLPVSYQRDIASLFHRSGGPSECPTEARRCAKPPPRASSTEGPAGARA